MEYMSCADAAEKWGISARRVQKLCEDNRIPGAVKFSRVWLIPKDAEKPDYFTPRDPGLSFAQTH